MNISITQGNTQENINSNIVVKLYQVAIATENNLILAGNLYTPTAYAYQVDYLNLRFGPNLIINIPESGKYIYFEDSEVESILKNAGVSSDGIGISVDDASKAIIAGNTSMFRENENIKSFNEFKYFTLANTNPATYLFSQTTNLTNIDLSNTIRISNYEFHYSGILTVNAPLLISLGTCGFQYSSVEDVEDLGNITIIPDFCFAYTPNLKSVNIPTTVTEIKSHAFSAYSKQYTKIFTTITGLDNVTIYGTNAFRDQTVLDIDASTVNPTSLAAYVFCKTHLSGILDMRNLISCGEACFLDTAVTKIKSLGKISSIPANSFSHAVDNSLKSVLTEVYLPYECISIESSAFRYDSGLTTLKQYTSSVDDWGEEQDPEYGPPTRVSIIGNYAFLGCALLNITQSDIPAVTTVGKYAFNDTLFSGTLDLSLFLSVAERAFQNTKISTVDLRNSVADISRSEYLFADNTSLLTVYIPANITVLPVGCFSGCTSLTSILGGFDLNSLTIYNNNIFRRCKINWGVLCITKTQLLNNTYYNNGTIDLGPTQMFSENTFQLLYLPNLIRTSPNSRLRSGDDYNSFLGGLNKYRNYDTKYGLIYMRDIAELYPGAFAYAKIEALVINNTTPPRCCNTHDVDDTLPGMPSANGGGWQKARVFSNINDASSNFIVYVPDSAISDYRTADVWNTHANKIHGMSELTRYPTKADWEAAGSPATGLIEEYM